MAALPRWNSSRVAARTRSGFEVTSVEAAPLGGPFVLGGDFRMTSASDGLGWTAEGAPRSNRFDDVYFSSVRTIGLVHNKIGLEPRWYVVRSGS